MKPNYYIQNLSKKIKYIVNYHDGTKTHKDGSPFYDIKILTNKKDATAFVNRLRKAGYIERLCGMLPV